ADPSPPPSPTRGEGAAGVRCGIYDSPHKRRYEFIAQAPIDFVLHSAMPFDARKVAVATTGFVAFLNLYSPQALLPALAQEFGVGAADISAVMTAGTAAIAL